MSDDAELLGLYILDEEGTPKRVRAVAIAERWCQEQDAKARRS